MIAWHKMKALIKKKKKKKKNFKKKKKKKKIQYIKINIGIRLYRHFCFFFFLGKGTIPQISSSSAGQKMYKLFTSHHLIYQQRRL
jgi:hypothetical protein